MLKRTLLLLSTVPVLYFGALLLWRALASDETKIRWLVEGMEEGYNEGRPRACFGPLALDWRHENYELDRELLRGALIRTALQDRDPRTKELLTKVELDDESLAITVDGDRASLECDLTFWRLRSGVWDQVWSMHATAELAEGDDGWKIVRSRHEDRRGTQLGR